MVRAAGRFALAGRPVFDAAGRTDIFPAFGPVGVRSVPVNTIYSVPAAGVAAQPARDAFIAVAGQIALTSPVRAARFVYPSARNAAGTGATQAGIAPRFILAAETVLASAGAIGHAHIALDIVRIGAAFQAVLAGRLLVRAAGESLQSAIVAHYHLVFPVFTISRFPSAPGNQNREQQ